VRIRDDCSQISFGKSKFKNKRFTFNANWGSSVVSHGSRSGLVTVEFAFHPDLQR